MTATPRIFGDNVRSKADEVGAELASMDNPDLFGETLFYRGFGWAVQNGLLTDYKVIVLAMDEGLVSAAVQKRLGDAGSELVLDDATKIVTSRLGDDRFRVAGTAEFSGYNRDIRDDRIRPLTRWVEQCFPGVCTRRVVPWAGLRPMLPNMMPRVGPGRLPTVFYNTGHGHLGWTLSAITAEMVADAVASAVSGTTASTAG